jgi:hypothetical protein
LALVLITGVAEGIRLQTVDPAQTFAALEDKILSKGPNGEKPSLAAVSLTAEDVEKIRC